MARPSLPVRVEQVSGNSIEALAASAQIYAAHRKPQPNEDRNQISQPWQVEAYRQVNICGEARYAATLFASLAARAEIGVSKPQALGGRADWVTTGPEVDAFAEIVPDVRARKRLVRDFMLHRVIAGECYLIARERVDTDPGYIAPLDEETTVPDLLDPDYDPDALPPNRAEPMWEIVAVTELRKTGNEVWETRIDNGNWVPLAEDDPVIRMWSPDPANRREAWSPYRSLLPTLREIEWLTQHIFTQVRSRLISSGAWFLPNNLTFPPPPPDTVNGGSEAISLMNEAEQFMMTLAASSTALLEPDEVAFPTVVMADPEALAAVSQDKLIKFWADIDDKAMLLRSDAVRRFALGMDLPPEQILGSSGMAVSGSSGSTGSVNHWGVWANEEQTISSHIEPALDDFVDTITEAFLRVAVPNTKLVIGYDTATLRLRQDRSAESMQLYDRGVLKAENMVRENGFDPDTDMMDDKEFAKWLLTRIAGGSATPAQVQSALKSLEVLLPALTASEEELAGVQDDQGYTPPVTDTPPGLPDRNAPPNPDGIPHQGPPTEQHDHTDAPFGSREASCEALVIRAMEKMGNRVLNEGKRGRDRDRSTPPHTAHLTASLSRTYTAGEFDFGLAPLLLGEDDTTTLVYAMGQFCADLYNSNREYRREDLVRYLRSRV